MPNDASVPRAISRRKFRTHFKISAIGSRQWKNSEQLAARKSCHNEADSALVFRTKTSVIANISQICSANSNARQKKFQIVFRKKNCFCESGIRRSVL